jgi:endogenous inhibitor of DNA gyrase (YacG/DUF329 family)
MPKDEWRNAKDRAVANKARAEYAATGGRSSYPYVGSDLVPPPPIADTSQAKAKKPNKTRKCPHCGKEIPVAKMATHRKPCKRARLRKLSRLFREKYRPTSGKGKGKKGSNKG